MSNIPSARQYIQIEGARLRSPVGESLVQTIGGTINYLIDQRDAIVAEDATQDGRLTVLETTKARIVTGSFTISGNTNTLLYTAPSTIQIAIASIIGGSPNDGGFSPAFCMQGFGSQSNPHGYSINVSGNQLFANANQSFGGTTFFLQWAVAGVF